MEREQVDELSHNIVWVQNEVTDGHNIEPMDA